jgi:hypothetical protein
MTLILASNRRAERSIPKGSVLKGENIRSTFYTGGIQGTVDSIAGNTEAPYALTTGMMEYRYDVPNFHDALANELTTWVK